MQVTKATIESEYNQYWFSRKLPVTAKNLAPKCDFDQKPLPDDLKGLTDYETIQAEYKIQGATVKGRAKHMGAVLGVDGEELANYVFKLSYRVRSDEPNRGDIAQELEQYLWMKLWEARTKLQGNKAKVFLHISASYKNWYRLYSVERQLGVEAINRAISLDREFARIMQGEATEKPKDGETWIGWEDALHGNIDGMRLWKKLPERMQKVAEKKLNKIALTVAERTYLLGWSRANKELLLAVMQGYVTGELSWNKPASKKKAKV